MGCLDGTDVRFSEKFFRERVVSKREDFGYIWKNLFFPEKGRLEGTTGKFRDFISEKGCLEGTSENFEKNKVQREKWPVPSNGPPCNIIYIIY